MSSPFSSESAPSASSFLTQSTAALVVDGDLPLRLSLKTFLREYTGLEDVHTTADASEALEIIQTHPSIEVILLSASLPDGEGLPLIDALAELGRPLSILLMANSDAENLESEFRKRGNETLLTNHFLTKPLSFEDLEPVILAARDEVHAAKSRLLAVPPPTQIVEQPPAEAETPTLIADPVEQISPTLVADSAEQVAPTIIATPAENHSSSPTTASTMLESILTRLSNQDKHIAALEKKLARQRRKWRWDIIKVIILGALIWTGLQRGWFRPLAPYWHKADSVVRPTVEDWITKYKAYRYGESEVPKAPEKKESPSSEKPRKQKKAEDPKTILPESPESPRGVVL